MTENPNYPMSGAEAEQVLRRYLDALVSGDLDAIGRSFAEEATWTLHGELPLAGIKRGREQIVNFLVDAGSLFRPGTQSFTFGDISAQSSRAVLEWQVKGIATRTGEVYDNDYCGVFVVEDGLIAEVREYLDSLHANRVLFGG